MPSDFHKLQIAGIIQETHDTRSFVFDVPEELRAQFEYEPGQFLSFKIPFQGRVLTRSYSLASSPHPAIEPYLAGTRQDRSRARPAPRGGVTAGAASRASTPGHEASHVWAGTLRGTCRRAEPGDPALAGKPALPRASLARGGPTTRGSPVALLRRADAVPRQHSGARAR